MALPFDVRDVYRFGKETSKDRDKPIELAVLVEIDAPERLLEAVREALRPRTTQAFVDVQVVEEEGPDLRPGTDAVIVLVGSALTATADTIERLRAGRIPVVALALAASAGELGYDLGLHADAVLAEPDPEVLVRDRLAAWLADELGAKRLALATNFEFTRGPVAEEVVKATSLQNGLIGVVAIFPGADMPLMTANQAKMLLQLATAYGQRIGADRLGELAAVIGGGFALRAVARQALTAVPGFGWAVKGGIAYGGTMAMGRAATAWFEEGADMGELVERLKGVAGLEVGPADEGA